MREVREQRTSRGGKVFKQPGWRKDALTTELADACRRIEKRVDVVCTKIEERRKAAREAAEQRRKDERRARIEALFDGVKAAVYKRNEGRLREIEDARSENDYDAHYKRLTGELPPRSFRERLLGRTDDVN